MDVSRRTVLGSIAAGAVVVGLSEPAHASDSGPRRPLALTVLQSVPLRTFDVTWAQETTLEVPLVLELAGFASGASRLEMTVSFDTRLLDATGDVVLAAAGAVWTAAPQVTGPDAAGLGVLRFSVARPDGRARTRDSTIVSLPLRPRELFPSENIGVPLPLEIAVGRQGSLERRAYRWVAPAATSGVAPWGALVTAAWAATAVGYRLPSAVRVESVGPLPVPAGASLTVEVDSALASSCTATAAAVTAPLSRSEAEVGADGGSPDAPADQPVDVALLQASSEQVGDVLRTRLVLPEVAAGSALRVQLAFGSTGDKVGRAIRFASVALTGTGVPGERLRDTGGYTTADLTASGTPQVDGVAVGTV